MAGYLTTHVLDTALGRPASGLSIVLYRLDAEGRHEVGRAVTNADGRTDGPILPEAAFARGTYELIFDAGAYLAAAGLPTNFLDLVSVRFRMDATDHYHVPLLLSPFGYSTYRGS